MKLLGAVLAALIPLHVPIMAYVGIDGYDPGPAVVSRYVTYARTGLQLRTGRSSCPQGTCTALFYVDTHNVYCDWGTQDWFRLAQSNEAWFMHVTVGGRRVTVRSSFGHCPDENGGALSYLANFADIDEVTYWKSFIDARIDKAMPNQCFFLDDISSFVAPPSAEVVNARSLYRHEGAEFDRYAPACLWTNGLGPGGGYFDGGVSTSGAMVAGASVDGAIPLDAYTRFNRAKNVLGVTFEDPLWARTDRKLRLRNVPVLVNTVSQLLDQTALKYAVLDRSTDVDGRDLEQVRRLHTAVLWLTSGDDPSRAVSWLDPYDGPNGRNRLGVYPEQLVVPTEPRTSLRAWRGGTANSSGCDSGRIDASAHGGTADLVAACGSNDGRDAGTYVREYQRCFSDGKPIGACAAIVNAQSVPVVLSDRSLHGRYAHEIDSAGGPLVGVCPEDAGCEGRLAVQPIATANGISVPAEDARLLVR